MKTVKLFEKLDVGIAFCIEWILRCWNSSIRLLALVIFKFSCSSLASIKESQGLWYILFCLNLNVTFSSSYITVIVSALSLCTLVLLWKVLTKIFTQECSIIFIILEESFTGYRMKALSMMCCDFTDSCIYVLQPITHSALLLYTHWAQVIVFKRLPHRTIWHSRVRVISSRPSTFFFSFSIFFLSRNALRTALRGDGYKYQLGEWYNAWLKYWVQWVDNN